jgi:hypothetical protein
MRHVLIVLLSAWLWAPAVLADEEPIAGTVKSIDPAAQTLVLESTARGKTRQVVVHLKPDTKIVRFVRPGDPAKAGFVEQSLALGDLKPGWIVSVEAKHEGGKEVAQVVKVVLER